ncbi:MAG: 30S ribosomal protein S6 [Spirulinaceae cyanobacterium SM2_1_0]|nr:30S ribosomal protein S6 [Spirulinaceae cyanobacterium SM2_1_0]
MARTYEMMYVLRPDLSEEQVNAAMQKYSEMLSDRGATNINVQFWGRRRLAYEIDRFQDGIYVLVHYQGDGAQIAPLERAMRLSEDVIRYLTLRASDTKSRRSSVSPLTATVMATAEEAEPAAEEA